MSLGLAHASRRMTAALCLATIALQSIAPALASADDVQFAHIPPPIYARNQPKVKAPVIEPPMESTEEDAPCPPGSAGALFQPHAPSPQSCYAPGTPRPPKMSCDIPIPHAPPSFERLVDQYISASFSSS